MKSLICFVFVVQLLHPLIVYAQTVVIPDDRLRNRCSGEVVFQKKPADVDDFGNFLNSTSFSEIDCAVKCYQKVPDCRAVRYDHVSKVCMYSNKDQGNCFRSKDDPKPHPTDRMITMYCIECLEINKTRTAPTRRLQPNVALFNTTAISNGSETTPVAPLSPAPVAQSGAPAVVPLQPDVASSSLSATQLTLSQLATQSTLAQLTSNSSAASSVAPNAAPLQSTVGGSSADPFSVFSVSTAQERNVNLPVIKAQGSETNQDIKVPVNEGSSGIFGNRISSAPPAATIPVEPSAVRISVGSQASGISALPDNLPKQPLSSAFVSPSTNQALQPSNATIPSSSAIASSSSPATEVTASSSAQIIVSSTTAVPITSTSNHPVTQPSNPASTAQPIAQTPRVANATGANEYEYEFVPGEGNSNDTIEIGTTEDFPRPAFPFPINATRSPAQLQSIQNQAVRDNNQKEISLNSIQSGLISFQNDAKVRKTNAVVFLARENMVDIFASSAASSQPSPSTAQPNDANTKPSPSDDDASTSESGASSLEPSSAEQINSTVSGSKSAEIVSSSPIPANITASTIARTTVSQVVISTRGSPSQQPPSSPLTSTPTEQPLTSLISSSTTAPVLQEKVSTVLPNAPKNESILEKKPLDNLNSPIAPQVKVQANAVAETVAPAGGNVRGSLAEALASGQLGQQLSLEQLQNLTPDPSCKDEDLMPCTSKFGRDCIVVKPHKCPVCFCPYRSPAKGCAGPAGLNELIRNELIQGIRNCPNGQTVQTVFRYLRRVDAEKKFDDCVRVVQPYCGVEQNDFWQMPRFLDDCYYYCYTDKELRARGFSNLTTID